MKKMTMLFAVMAAIVISPMVTRAQCAPCGKGVKQESAKKCAENDRKKAECARDRGKDAGKCDKQSAKKHSRCADKNKKCD